MGYPRFKRQLYNQSIIFLGIRWLWWLMVASVESTSDWSDCHVWKANTAIAHDCCATLKTKVIVLICFEKELCKHTCAKHFQVVLFTKIYDDRVCQAVQVPHFSNVLFLHKKVQILSIIQDKYTFVLCTSTRYLLCFGHNCSR